MKKIKETLLHYQKGTSNKVYNVYLVEISPSEYLVNFEYGRYGATLREGTKTSSPVPLERAEKLFDSLVVSKMNKEYTVQKGYDATKKEEKKERKALSALEYQELIVSRLKKAQEESLRTVDNYEVSRLIYRAGELKIEEAKAHIMALYEMRVDSSNAFYYSVAWALGRFRDASLRNTIESISEKLSESSRYIVSEALFLLQEAPEKAEIEKLTFPMPFESAFNNKNGTLFEEKVELLAQMIDEMYEGYKALDDYYDDDKKKQTKKELMPLIKKLDEIYIKLYMHGSIDAFAHKLFVNLIACLPLTKFNFSLFRRLHKMADMRDDHEVMGRLITKIESKKMACYEVYSWNEDNKRSLGCSRRYFKKRALRHLKSLALHEEKGYLEMAKALLVSLNEYPTAFLPYERVWYDENWSIKKKKYDAFASHITAMYVMYGAGKRYMIEPSKKQWETANQSIQNEHRAEIHKEIWDRYPKVALEILSLSGAKVVQKFAFDIVKEHPEVVESASLSELLPMLNSKHDEARAFFFELLKKRYEAKGEKEIIVASLLSSYDAIAEYALGVIEDDLEILTIQNLVAEVAFSSSDYIFSKLLSVLEKLEKLENATQLRILVEELMARLMSLSLPLQAKEKIRFTKTIIALSKAVEQKDLELLFSENELNDRAILGAILIREEAFARLELSLELKEKIATYDHPEMLATTLYLLGKLNEEELMAEHEMLVAFLYHEALAVHGEARKIIERLSQKEEQGRVLLKAIVEKSFVSASNEVRDNVEATVENMQNAYGAIEPDQLYRMLIAKSKLAVALGGLILTHYKATEFSVVQWARMAKNENKSVRVWAYRAYEEHQERVKEAMPKSLMIFDTSWEDTRSFAFEYFKAFDFSTDEIVVIADSNYTDVQDFAKAMIEKGNYDREILLTKLSQHPAVRVQKFVTDLMLQEMSDEQLLKMERFFNGLLHGVNQNRVAKTRVMYLLKKRLDNHAIANMVARLAYHHSATMVWADKEVYVEMMAYIAQNYKEIALPLSIEEVEKREVV